MNDAGSTAGGAAGVAGAPPDACATTGDGLSNGDANGPVGAPPEGYLVYLAETPSLGKQVFQVRIHDGVVAKAVRLTPDAGVDGFLVSAKRRAIIAVTGAVDQGKLLELVDFDGSGVTGTHSLNGLSRDTPVFTSYDLDPDGSTLFASADANLWFFDLRSDPVTAPRQINGYNLLSPHGWAGSRLVFSGSKVGLAGQRIFSANPDDSPPVAELLAPPTGGTTWLLMAPNRQRAIAGIRSSSGDTEWSVLDLTTATPVAVKLTSPALRGRSTPNVRVWSPDSRYYLAEVDPGGLVLVDTEDPSSGQVVSAAGATKFTYASFSPDSRRLVYAARHGDSENMQVYGVALEPGGPSAAYPLIRGTEDEQSAYVTQTPGLFEWMRGSRYVVYSGLNPSAAYVADASGCSGRRVPFMTAAKEPAGQNGLHPAPNARRAAFYSWYRSPDVNDVYVADIDDEGNWGPPTRLSGPEGTGLATELRFLDSDWVMFKSEDADRRVSLYLAPRDGSTPARLVNEPQDAVLYSPYWIAGEP